MFYVRVKLQNNQSSRKPCNIGKNMIYEFCYLFSFDLWIFYLTGSFSYKDITTCFKNFLVLQGFLIGSNITFKCGNDSLMF